MLLKIKRVVKYNPEEGWVLLQLFDELNPSFDQIYKYISKLRHSLVYNKIVEADEEHLYAAKFRVKLMSFQFSNEPLYHDYVEPQKMQDEYYKNIQEGVWSRSYPTEDDIPEGYVRYGDEILPESMVTSDGKFAGCRVITK